MCCRISEFPIWKEGRCFTVNVGVPLAIAYFQHGSSTKGIDIKNVVRNGRDTLSMVCLPRLGSYGNGVPLGFGPWGNFGSAWGNPVCHADGVNFWVPGVRNHAHPVPMSLQPDQRRVAVGSSSSNHEAHESDPVPPVGSAEHMC